MKEAKSKPRSPTRPKALGADLTALPASRRLSSAAAEVKPRLQRDLPGSSNGKATPADLFRWARRKRRFVVSRPATPKKTIVHLYMHTSHLVSSLSTFNTSKFLCWFCLFGVSLPLKRLVTFWEESNHLGTGGLIGQQTLQDFGGQHSGQRSAMDVLGTGMRQNNLNSKVSNLLSLEHWNPPKSQRHFLNYE